MKKKLTLKEIEDHYNESKQNYEDLAKQGVESHIAYYRDKYPEYYQILIDAYNEQRD